MSTALSQTATARNAAPIPPYQYKDVLDSFYVNQWYSESQIDALFE